MNQKQLLSKYSEMHLSGEKLISGQNIWNLRGAYPRQAKFLNDKERDCDRIFFSMPNKVNMTHLGIYDRALNLSLDMFCTDMVSSCKDWYGQHKNDGNVLKNLEHGLNFYPSGTYPYLYIEGVDIIG